MTVALLDQETLPALTSSRTSARAAQTNRPASANTSAAILVVLFVIGFSTPFLHFVFRPFTAYQPTSVQAKNQLRITRRDYSPMTNHGDYTTNLFACGNFLGVGVRGQESGVRDRGWSSELELESGCSKGALALAARPRRPCHTVPYPIRSNSGTVPKCSSNVLNAYCVASSSVQSTSLSIPQNFSRSFRGSSAAGCTVMAITLDISRKHSNFPW